MTLSIVVPAYNEEDSIGTVLDRLLDSQKELKHFEEVEEVEIIVVDDGSTDSTIKVARSRLGRIKIIPHTQNMGYGAALKTGLKATDSTVLAFLDSDGTYPPEELSSLIEVFLTGQYDMVTGSRRISTPKGMPATRRLGNSVFSALASIVTGKRITDPASGMRVLKRSMLQYVDALPDDLSFALAMTLRAARDGLQVAEVPVPYSNRIGRSKLSWIRDGFRFALRIVEP